MMERPILLNTDMVRAVIDGRKTQTRRPVKNQPKNGWAFEDAEKGGAFGRITSSHPKKGKFGAFIRRGVGTDFPETDIEVCPFGMPGDRLWVRETWFQKGCYCMPMFDGADHEDAFWSGTKDVKHFASEDVSSDGHTFGEQFWRKLPSIHMPRWACRLMLEITDVRIEQVQSITEEDATKEGLLKEARQEESDLMGWNLAKTTFEELWGKLYPNSWTNNDWVWVIDFKIVELNGKNMEQAA